MATTRIMPLHIGKGRTESRAISAIIDYVANPQKTDHGKLITGYECDSRVADAEFMLAKRQYMLIDFVQDESHSVLVSSHITSDLEKVADYITFIHKGKLIFTHEKDNLIDNYGVLNCGVAVFDTLDKSEVVAYRKEDYQFKVLVKDRNKAEKQYANAIVGPATIEEIMLFYVKGEMQ